MRSMRKSVAATVFVSVFLALLWSSACAAPPAAKVDIPVKLGWSKVSGQVSAPIAIAKGFDREFGVAITMVPFPTAPESVQGAVTGATDGSFGSSVPSGPSLILNGAPIRSSMIYGYGGNRGALVTVKSAGVNSVKDLAGKTVGTPIGSDPEMLLIKALQEAGVNPDTVKRVNMAYADQPAALMTGQIQAASTTEPSLSSFLAQEPSAFILVRGGPYVSMAGSLYFSENFRKAPDDAAYKTYLALAKAQQWIRQVGTDSEELLKITAENTGTKIKNVKPGFKNLLFDPRFKPWTWKMHKGEMDFYVSIGKLTRAITRDEFYDISFQERAMREHPELFSDLNAYLEANGAAKDELNVEW